MQKLANKIIDKMLAATLNSKEIDFFIYISRFQDERGHISGVHYKDVCENMHMSYQEFYNVKQSLEENGFIRCEKTNRIDHDITILGNVYAGREQEYLSEGYVNTNHNIFNHPDFFTMKAGAKLLALKFVQLGFAGTSGRYEIGVKRFYDKYTELLGVTRRVIRSYLKELKDFFSIGIKDKKYYITPKKIVRKRAYAKTEMMNYREHNVDVICRRNRIKVKSKERQKVIDLLAQYKNIAPAMGKNPVDALARAVSRSLETINETTSGTWKREINIKLIHKFFKQELELPPGRLPYMPYQVY